jgi:hypothetical protein
MAARGFPNSIRISALVCKRCLLYAGGGRGRDTEMLDIIMLALGL